MSDRMTCLPLSRLLNLMFGEYVRDKSIFGIPESRFFRKTHAGSIELFGERCDTPIGPAAGPHTQLAQNIIASYLCGGRFIELKTVQKMDSLEFDKPCIDARDEAYNTEWSTELSLTDARREYTKAWIVCHLLERVFGLGTKAGVKGFIFNMSIGYTLEGIKTEPMDRFIMGLIDASSDELFSRYLEDLRLFVSTDNFRSAVGENADSLGDLADSISPRICRSVTLSTMHGCPPDEQGSICRYLLSEKKLHTYVKLNPTLLGYRTVRESLNSRGFSYIDLKEETFLHDLQYADALKMLGELKKTADTAHLSFGVKLSNTLASVNPGDVLPGAEQYMSGRALFPLTLLLADRIQGDFPRGLPVSFAGGVSVHNAAALFSTGIRPLTLATEILKPSGYLRMIQIAETLDREASKGHWDMTSIDRSSLGKIREELSGSTFFEKSFRGTMSVSVDKILPMFDCAAAPCSEACPVGQDVPEYIRLTAEGRHDEALACIYRTNPLPSVTGTICDHRCMTRCTRLDYEGPVRIRDMKRIAADLGRGYVLPQVSENGLKAAVVGAGPAGLAAAFFLRRAGFTVRVFEKRESAGGVVRHVLPSFRIPEGFLDRDIERIAAMGVEFEFGVEGTDVTELKNRGYDYIFIGIGAEKPRDLVIDGPCRIVESLDFLKRFKADALDVPLGKRIAVVGGGNTAMDGARAAARCPGVETVYIIYRRTEEQMPADREEFDNALAEGIIFKPLLQPQSCPGEGLLECRVMKLGDSGPDGRPVPVPSAETVRLDIDTVISAVGETADLKTLKALGLPVTAGRVTWNPETLETDIPHVYLGGDAGTGPSTVVEAMADGKKAAEDICRKAGVPFSEGTAGPSEEVEDRISSILSGRGYIRMPSEDFDNKAAFRESERCLDCSSICNKCVEVCPNRANIPLRIHGAEFSDIFQILHIDPFCNECGNCATFCPYDGRPYRDKFTLFSAKDALDASENPGVCFTGGRIETAVIRYQRGGKPGPWEKSTVDPRFRAIIETIHNEYGYIVEALHGEKENQ